MEPDIRYWIEQGKEHFKNQAYKKAESLLLKVVASKHQFADVFNMLGIIYHQTGQFNDAIDYFKKALAINNHYTEAMLNLSVLYNDLGDYKHAKELVEKFKKDNKKTSGHMDPFIKSKLANKHAEVADMYRGVGLYKEAINEYGLALALAPTYHDIRTKMGICLRELGKKPEALKEFLKIVKDKPGYADANLQLGITYFSMNKKKEAKLAWTKLAKTAPQHPLVKTYLRLVADKAK